jgi:hypothetical protein
MSESTSTPAPTPAAPAQAPAPAPAIDAGGSPPATSQPPLSLTEAGRLLRQQRRGPAAAPAAPANNARPAAAAPPAPAQERRPSANEMRAASPQPGAAAPGAAAGSAPTAAAPTPATTGLTALEQALGVPAPDGAAPALANDTAAGIEIEGRRYTAAELREAVSKASDYTQKTQQLARDRQQIQAQTEALATVIPLIQPELARLAQMVQNPPQRPDPALLETNPQQYLKDRAAWESAVEEQNRLGSINQVQAAANARALEQAVAAANETLAKEFPFWGDPQQRLAAQQQIVEWATTDGGFTRAELAGLSSPHHLKAMMKAMAWDKFAKTAKTAAPPQIGQPARGQAPPPAPTERVAAASDAFAARPSIKSAAALLAARRANGAAA